jgi:hypothetical protein
MGSRAQHSAQNGNRDSVRVARGSSARTPPVRATLQSWKEIASDLNRGVRTIQRWERTLGLPIRRVGTGPRCPVFAFKDELDDWLRSTTAAWGSRKQKTSSRKDLEILADTKAERVLDTINDFFVTGTSIPAKTECEQCHLAMQYLQGDFWIYGTSMKWRMSVPFCPVCDADSLARFHHSQIIQ